MAASPDGKARPSGAPQFAADTFSLWSLGAPSKPVTKVSAEPAAYLASDESPFVAGPLKNRFAGRIISSPVETVFDRLFRGVGDGSFDAEYLLARGCNLMYKEPAAWINLPEEGNASAIVTSANGDATEIQAKLPVREVEYARQWKLPNWARMLADFPAAIKCTEKWTLHGLGKDESFALDMEIQTKDAPFSDAFVLRTRCKATSLGNDDTQLDAEAEVIWLKTTLLQSRIERALVEEFQKTFEVTFLPLAAKKLKPRTGSISAAPPAPTSTGQQDATPSGQQEAVDFQTEKSGGDADKTPENATPSSSSAEKRGASKTGATDSSVPRKPGRNRKTTVEYELRVEVLSAANLSSPEYRLGDLTTGWMRKQFQNVYVELQMGDKTSVSGCAVNPDGLNSIEFVRERMLFVYGGEMELRLNVYDKRGLQAALRGDPLIGYASFRLDPSIKDGYPRWQDLPLQRSDQKRGESCGTVQLRSQLITTAANAAARARSKSKPAPKEQPEAPAPTVNREIGQDLDAEYATPTSTPRRSDMVGQ
mmetsp:Transcript_16919/g.39400  ORF Transcript_16919/g.39400 Transcript_16919/m.39400 type:complete len:536 (-) Transcript_16919:120-1727(-)